MYLSLTSWEKAERHPELQPDAAENEKMMNSRTKKSNGEELRAVNLWGMSVGWGASC